LQQKLDEYEKQTYELNKTISKLTNGRSSVDSYTCGEELELEPRISVSSIAFSDRPQLEIESFCTSSPEKPKLERLDQVGRPASVVDDSLKVQQLTRELSKLKLKYETLLAEKDELCILLDKAYDNYERLQNESILSYNPDPTIFKTSVLNNLHAHVDKPTIVDEPKNPFLENENSFTNELFHSFEKIGDALNEINFSFENHKHYQDKSDDYLSGEGLDLHDMNNVPDLELVELPDLQESPKNLDESNKTDEETPSISRMQVDAKLASEQNPEFNHIDINSSDSFIQRKQSKNGKSMIESLTYTMIGSWVR
jgi:hypothetical protein